MKRISLIALSATAAMAQAPKATAPAPLAPVAQAPAPVTAPVSYASSYSAPEPAAATEASTAPIAPVHDQLIQGNPALPTSIAGLFVTPGDYYGKREAAFQWGSASASFNGVGLAVVDQFFAGFENSDVANQGTIAGGYLTPKFGAGLKLTLDKTWSSSDSISNPYTKETSNSYAVSGIGAFGSGALNNLTVYGEINWFTPLDYGSTTTETATPVGKATATASDRSDAFQIGVGAKTAALGDAGLSWNVQLEYTNFDYRHQGVSSDSTHPVHIIQQLGQIGKTFSAEGFILAVGLDENLQYINGYGGFDTLHFQATDVVPAGLPKGIYAPDYGYTFALQPTLAVILPIFEHWSVKGGARAGLVYMTDDSRPGSKAVSGSGLQTTAPTGSVGVRYARGRWAAEAALTKGALDRGPYFVSGSGANLFSSFALTANFK